MCILFIYTNPNPPAGGYRLIVASNRDEFYRRPARNAFLCPETGIIGGRDMEPGREGGMWLGVSVKPPAIKFAALLNVTGEEKRQATSGRGPLVHDYLKTDETALDYVRNLPTETYSAFNLFMMEVTKDKSSGYHHSNSPQATKQYHGAQVLAFGNSTPDAPFTKVKAGREKFKEIIARAPDRDGLVAGLINLLKCGDLHLPDPELERRAPRGVGFLSAIFVNMRNGGYGTRTHSVVLVDDECNVEFVEHTMRAPIDPENPEWDVTVVKSRL
jgi:uncharacterized protein with NRDE domain